MSKVERHHSLVEEIFEGALFNCRFLVLLAVLGSLFAAVMMFLKGAIELIQAANAFLPTLTHFQINHSDDKEVIVSVIPAIDYFLFATVLLMFSMGIYELFISEIDPAFIRRNAQRPNWLNVKTLDDLKSQIGKVVMMILIVNFFQQAFNISYSSPMDLLYLGAAILLVAVSLFVTKTIVPSSHHLPTKTAAISISEAAEAGSAIVGDVS
jgi:uncharacterized membrane protein YqhA